MDIDNRTERKREREKAMLRLMIEVYCRGNRHADRSMRASQYTGSHRINLCDECNELLEYAVFRTSKCPFMAKKSFCSACKVHCYNEEHKERIRQVMRYAGPRMLLYHPFAALHHCIITLKSRIFTTKSK